MRTLHADLTAAQKLATAEPAVQVVAREQAQRHPRPRLRATRRDAQTVASHGAAVPTNGSLNRIRVAAGTVYHQRLTNPQIGPLRHVDDHSSPARAPTSPSPPKGRAVALVYVNAAGTGIAIRESTDSGASFGGPVAVATAAAALTGLAVATRTAPATSPSPGPPRPPSTSPSGPAAAAGARPVRAESRWPASTVSACATASTTTSCSPARRSPAPSARSGPSSTETARTPPSARGRRCASSSRPRATPASRIKRPSSPTATRTIFAGSRPTPSPAATRRTFRSHLHPLATYVLGAWTVRAPIPTDYAGASGLAVAFSSTYAYECAADTLRHASRATVTSTSRQTSWRWS